MGPSESPDIEALLGHADWLRKLARRLVPSGMQADDVVQETWLAAVRRPPRDSRNVRGWLAAVARNAGLQIRRSEGRRAAREALALPTHEPPDPAAIAARAEIQREVADAVLTLEEPYRTLIVLRFYEGRDSREIARTLGIALATVRSRQKRAIERLRERLDARRGGDRRAWCHPLVALALPSPARPSPSATIPLVLVTLALIAGVLVLLLRPGTPAPDGGDPAARTAAGRAAIEDASRARRPTGSSPDLEARSPPPGPHDLAAIYPATSEERVDPGPVDWACGPQDVWYLTSFRYRYRDLHVELGPSEVVFGVSSSGVVWAAVLPSGNGSVSHAETGVDPVASVWLRFHPSRVGELFPMETIRGRGSPLALVEARRLYQHKIRGCWQIEDTPVIPSRPWIVIDIDTTTGMRRFFELQTDRDLLEYLPRFETRALLPRPADPIATETGLRAYDRVWDLFDEGYPMFVLRPGLDWDRARNALRPLAAECRSAYEAAGVIALMVSRLEDLQAWVLLDGRDLPGYIRRRPLNMSGRRTRELLSLTVDAGHGLTWGRTGDGFGYVFMLEFTGPETVEAFDGALDALADTKGLILDLRANGGGDESAAVDIGGRFVAKERVYSMHRVRSGPGRHDLSEPIARRCAPRGPWPYRQPVMLLQGMKTFGTAESFVLMLRGCPQVTTIGDRTAGSSGHAIRHDVGAGIVVYVPSVLDLTPEGRPIDRSGVAPDVAVEVSTKRDPPDDPVMREALRRLRSR